MKLVAPAIVSCNNCGNTVMLHRVCTKCGFYRGRQVLTPATNA
jgi:large subunit ribosomal protein L32